MKKRLLLAAGALALLLALYVAGSWLLGPGRAVGRLEKAYARADRAAAAPLLTDRGRRIFETGLDPEWYGPPTYLKTEETARRGREAAFRVNALTRYGPVLSELHLVRQGWRWKLDEVVILSLDGNEVGVPASSLLDGR